jgi:tetratricopeptide (TPR) repeat protein
MLAQAWAKAGQAERARQRCQDILRDHPRQPLALALLGDLCLAEDQLEAALNFYEQALLEAPEQPHLLAKRDACQVKLESAWPSAPDGRLCLWRQKRFASHRGGWGYALDALRPLHHHAGIHFEGSLEHHFSGPGPGTPIERPWVGFLHNAASMPDWYMPHLRPQALLAHSSFKRSLEYCQGLFTLSEELARWLRPATGKPVCALYYPSEIPPCQFQPERFLQNQQRCVVQVGWWLRRLGSIFRLPLGVNNPAGYSKIFLVTHPFPEARKVMQDLMDRDPQGHPPACPNTRELNQLSDQDYDQLLTSNLAFLDLYDSSANTAVVECLARATPLLVNRLPAVEEYLGSDYPLYFGSLEEAAAKALDLDLVIKTHQYLLNCPGRSRLSQPYFCQAMRESAIYRALT